MCNRPRSRIYEPFLAIRSYTRFIQISRRPTKNSDKLSARRQVRRLSFIRPTIPISTIPSVGLMCPVPMWRLFHLRRTEKQNENRRSKINARYPNTTRNFSAVRSPFYPTGPRRRTSASPFEDVYSEKALLIRFPGNEVYSKICTVPIAFAVNFRMLFTFPRARIKPFVMIVSCEVNRRSAYCEG